MPGRTPMKARICEGLRRTSFSRSAALRSGLATIASICDVDKGAGDFAAGARLQAPMAPTRPAQAAAFTRRRSKSFMGFPWVAVGCVRF